jgi:CRISPR-associated protein Csd2
MKGIKDRDEYAKRACETWLDVRTFGQVFAFKDAKGLSVGVRGPVSVHHAVSVSPVEVESLQITKSVNGEKKEKGENRASDTMGMKHFVRFGLYEIKGSINVQLAEKTGFTEEDAETVKECLRTLFVNDASSARPDGSMEVVKLYWFKHNCKEGQYSSAKVHRSLTVTPKPEINIPSSADDYNITLTPLDGLDVEIIDGL